MCFYTVEGVVQGIKKAHVNAPFLCEPIYSLLLDALLLLSIRTLGEGVDYA